MRSAFLLFAICFTVVSQTKTYNGAWFDIKYPSTFTARSGEKSATLSTEFESAFFLSPDKQVEFYVYSPQWNGEPSDIDVTKTEKKAATSTKKRVEITGDEIEENWWTITANDKSYVRSYYQYINNTLNTTKIFGIKYKNQKALDKYKKQYADFKKSLIQYAD
ncbi:MAG: hypothetical protein RL115_696 [Bacteroidota bacterium]|jgi:hypothetical protein